MLLNCLDPALPAGSSQLTSARPEKEEAISNPKLVEVR
jgi:hypothetical protein